MAQLSIPKTYKNGEILLEADLDQIKDNCETLINTTGLSDDNISDNGLNGSNLVASAITGAKLKTTAVDDASIELSSSTLTIKALGVTLAKLASGAVDTAEITDGIITSAMITDGTIERAKFGYAGAATYSSDPGETGLSQSGSSGSFTVSGGTEEDPTNNQVTLTTSGRPVFLTVISDQASTSGTVQETGPVPSLTRVRFKMYRGTTSLIPATNATEFWCKGGGDGVTNATWSLPISAISFIDTPAAGTYTYKYTITAPIGGGQVIRAQLLAIELL